MPQSLCNHPVIVVETHIQTISSNCSINHKVYISNCLLSERFEHLFYCPFHLRFSVSFFFFRNLTIDDLSAPFAVFHVGRPEVDIVVCVSWSDSECSKRSSSSELDFQTNLQASFVRFLNLRRHSFTSILTIWLFSYVNTTQKHFVTSLPTAKNGQLSCRLGA
jgi:hypothetical protein